MSHDQKTADAFANSWNNLPAGSVYTKDQFEEWFAPRRREDAESKRVLEMGCGNASLMVHMLAWKPAFLLGVDLGTSVYTGEKNMRAAEAQLGAKQGSWKLEKGDIVEFRSEGFDLVYSIGVLHHLKEPKKGFDAVVANTVPGGKFHCWVYAREGNAVILYIVDSIRKIVSKLPWWFTKYFVATPLVVPYYIYAKILAALPKAGFLKALPLYDYSQWIAKREFSFFRHVAFDQLVTPQTTYLSKATLESWLKSHENIDQASTYMIFRNGNSWKFGGNLL